jgi:glycosyltransferase involved in cell wall biosynthesis
VNVLMVTPHLPPYQAANALLPHLLGESLRGLGHGVEFLTFGEEADTKAVGYVRRRRAWRATRLPQALEAYDTWRKASPRLRRADVVHVHSNTWMNQVAARLASRNGRPYVLTHYGTEIWHHDGKDRAFRRFNADARAVAFYSQALLDRARELAVPAPRAAVVYPPVPDVFQPRPEAERRAVRARFLGGADGALLLNVKRLHPLADQATLLRAFATVRAARTDAVLLVAGSGEEQNPLRRLAQELALGDAVRFLGLVPNDEIAALQAAADLFVLSSVLEATPTVALEALASGTPVVSTDNPGGVELGAIFGDDVQVVPKSDPPALARAVLEGLRTPRRTRERTAQILGERFRLPGVTARYLELYQGALAA